MVTPKPPAGRVLKIIIDAQFEDTQARRHADERARLRGDARHEGQHHHGRDLPRIGGDTTVGDAMHHQPRSRPHLVQGTWRECRLASRHPGGQVLKSAERTQRIGQWVSGGGLGVHAR